MTSGPRRRLASEGRDAGVDEAVGADNEHVRQIAARHRPGESSECRGTGLIGPEFQGLMDWGL
jgi:hypothetical protein